MDTQTKTDGKTSQEKTFVLLMWDEKLGEHKQVLLTKSLQQPKEDVIYLHQFMRLDKTYEVENFGKDWNKGGDQ